MAPSGKCSQCESSTLSQGDVGEASICYLVAEDVSASRKPLGGEDGHPSLRAAAPAEVLVHVAPAGSSTAPGAAADSSGLGPPPPPPTQEGFLHLERQCPRAQNREDGPSAGCRVPLRTAPAPGLEQVEGGPGSAHCRAVEADARPPAPPVHLAAGGAVLLGGRGFCWSLGHPLPRVGWGWGGDLVSLPRSPCPSQRSPISLRVPTTVGLSATGLSSGFLAWQSKNECPLGGQPPHQSDPLSRRPVA